jgi:LPXTG-motif cell wall-anchored protein
MLGNRAMGAFLFATGVVGISYGMRKDNNLVFIAGLLFLIGGYLLVRKKLKQHIRNLQ